MSRNAGVSCDEADAMIMLVHVVRKNSDIIPGLVEQQDSKTNLNQKDQIRFYTVAQMSNVAVDDSISTSGHDEY